MAGVWEKEHREKMLSDYRRMIHEQTQIRMVGIREEHDPGIPWIETGI